MATTRAVTEEKVAKAMGLVGERGMRRGVYLTVGAIEHAQRDIAKPWPAAAFWKYMARLVDTGVVKVAKEHGELGEEWGLRVARAGGGIVGTRERRVRAAAEWMQKYVTCREGVWEVKIGQLDSMVQDLTRGESSGRARVTRQEIYCAVMVIAAEKKATVQVRMLGKGGAKREWRQEWEEWMVQEKWFGAGEARKVMDAAGLQIKDMEREILTVIEGGAGYYGATDGLLQEVNRVVTIDRESHNLGELRGREHPEITAEFCRKGKQTVVEMAMSRGKVHRREVVGLWFSASCGPWSTGNGLGKSKGVGKGPHAGQEVEPEELQAVDAMIESVDKFERKGKGGNRYFIENVAWGGLKDHPPMKAAFGEGSRHGAREGIVMGCAYGLKHQGPYRFWTNLTEEEWMPRVAEDYCVHCREGTQHEEVMIPGVGDHRSRPTLPGYTMEAARNRVPPPLAASVARGFLKAHETRWKKKRRRQDQE